MSDIDTDPNCLHCKISLCIIEHFREAQGLGPDAYPDFGTDEVAKVLSNLAQVVADTIPPCEQGDEQLLRRVAIFSNSVFKRARQRDLEEKPGARLQ